MLDLITDVPFLTNYVIIADDVTLNTRQRHFKGDTVHEAALMQNRKFRLICLNFASTCSSRPNLENEYPHFMFLTINKEDIWSLKSPNHASCPPLLLNVS